MWPFKKRTHKFKVGDKVIFTNIFGVCWGVKTITGLTFTHWSTEDNKAPAYDITPTDTPWFPCEEKYLVKATKKDLTSSIEELRARYGFVPTEYFGCY